MKTEQQMRDEIAFSTKMGIEYLKIGQTELANQFAAAAATLEWVLDDSLV